MINFDVIFVIMLCVTFRSKLVMYPASLGNGKERHEFRFFAPPLNVHSCFLVGETDEKKNVKVLVNRS